MSTSSTDPVLVLALGNPLRGDDGVAQCVLQALAQEPLGAGVKLLDGGIAGLETVTLLQGWARAVILDAADFGAPAGTVRRIDLHRNSRRALPAPSNSLHTAGLLEALALADALGTLPGRLTLVGVQPAHIDFECGLSLAVTRAIPEAVGAVLAALAES